MNDILSEKQYQHEIMDYLQSKNGYRVRNATEFDRSFAMDRGMLFDFLNATQSDTMAELEKIYKSNLEETIVNVINAAVTAEKSSLVEVLKSGVEFGSYHLDLMYTKPATTYNERLNRLYEANILSVMEEVWASDDERIDLVIFLNGLAIIALELKCNPAGQTYENAIIQYRTKRSPKTRLFRFKAGTVVNFAMDLNEVYMTTRLNDKATVFLPFNMGNGTGVTAGAGNPIFKDRCSVSYMWENILAKDTVLDVLSKFIFVERKEEKDEDTGRERHIETLIFPRYHQLDLIRKLLESVREHGTDLNYLIEHSAGSGKTNSIAWLTYRLASLHDVNNQVIFDNIIIVTDRVVVDRQLQRAILGMDHKAGLIRVMDDQCTANDLARELSRNTKIIATTIQKFPYIVDTVANLHDKRFAVIIDEAHSSTAGKYMIAVTTALGSGDQAYENADDAKDVDDIINEQIEKAGKQHNVSMFAFTATPKTKTLRLFGQQNAHGQYEAFHLYSMKQAIEEEYILDVLQNFTEYETLFKLNKEIEEDPELKTNDAKRKIAQFIDLNEENVGQRVEIIVEHFRTTVMGELGGKAKAMVVTASRQAAVRYRQAFEDYINKKHYEGISPLVAFSGKVKLPDDETEYTEVSMNGFREEQLPMMFDSDKYNILIVANKYQTGFDQKKLCAMYVLKNLQGVNAVQTFSRLNRICPPYDKKTFILDFVNKYADIQDAFAPFYTTTLLSGDLEPKHIYDIEDKLDAFYVMDPEDIEDFINIQFNKQRDGKITSTEEKKLEFCLCKAERAVKRYSSDQQKEIRSLMRSFVQFYEFLILASCFKDVEIHKKYVFITYLLPYLNTGGGSGFDPNGKIGIDWVEQEKGETHGTETLVSDSDQTLPPFNGSSPRDEQIKKLSQIIDDINSRTGKTYDKEVAVNSVLQICETLMRSYELNKSAKSNNEKDFQFPFYDAVDNALMKGRKQNQDFFTLLLDNEEIKRKVLGIFANEIYKSLRDEELKGA